MITTEQLCHALMQGYIIEYNQHTGDCASQYKMNEDKMCVTRVRDNYTSTWSEWDYCNKMPVGGLHCTILRFGTREDVAGEPRVGDIVTSNSVNWEVKAVTEEGVMCFHPVYGIKSYTREDWTKFVEEAESFDGVAAAVNEALNGRR
jgi:hypothetical protein